MFQNREEAGLLLAERLKGYKDKKDAGVFAIPRGGVVVGKKISETLHLPLSLIVVKKIGAPHNPELAIGAMAADNVKVIDWELALKTGVDQEYLSREIEAKKREIEERVKKFQIPNSKFQIPNYQTIILTDDGVATGATVLAAIKYINESQKSKVKSQKSRIILAVPVIAKDSYERLKSEVEEIIALEIPEFFGAVGEFYREFPQISDEEVIDLLK